VNVEIFTATERHKLAQDIERYVRQRDESDDIEIQFSTAVDATHGRPMVIYSALVTARRPRQEAERA
jgi:hypothetical protein